MSPPPFFPSMDWTHFLSHSLQPPQCLPHQHQNLQFILLRKTMRWNILLIRATAINQCSLLDLQWANLRWSSLIRTTLDSTATTLTTSRLAINLVSLLLHLPWLPESTALTSLSSLLEPLQMGQHLITTLKRTLPSLYMVSVNSSIKKSLHSFPHLISLVCSPTFLHVILATPIFVLHKSPYCGVLYAVDKGLHGQNSLHSIAIDWFHTCMLIWFVISSFLQYRGCSFQEWDLQDCNSRWHIHRNTHFQP